MRPAISLILFSIATLLSGQQAKVPLTESAYFHWKRINNTKISNDGRWLSYELNPGHGDGVLELVQLETLERQQFPAATQAHFDAESQWLVFSLSPPKTTLDSLKRRKVQEDDLPSDTLCILHLAAGHLTKIPHAANHQLPVEWGQWLFYTIDHKRDTSLAEIFPRPATKSEKVLIRRHLPTGAQDTTLYATGHGIAPEAPVLFVASTAADSTKTTKVLRYDLRTGNSLSLFEDQAVVESLTSDRHGARSSFLAKPNEADTAQALMYWQEGQPHSKEIASSASDFLPPDWLLSVDHANHFSEDGSKLFFGIRPAPLHVDSTLLEDQIPVVEVWSYNDAKLYPQQELQKKAEAERSYVTVYDVESGAIRPLTTQAGVELQLGDEGNAHVALAVDARPYQKSASWEGRTRKDVSLIDIRSGGITPLAEGIVGSPRLSPAGRYAYWYEPQDSVWRAYDVANGEGIILTPRALGPFYDENNDRPNQAGSYGAAGWSMGDEHVYLNDRYDIWRLDPTGEDKPVRLTKGRERKSVFRYISLDPKARHLPADTILLHLFNESTKSEAYVRLDLGKGESTELLSEDMQLMRRPIKAKDASTLVYTKESYDVFPDLVATDLAFRHHRQVSHANPQQKGYKWGSIELVEWTSFDGEPLQGLLVKPEDFDPNKKYPMIVNFYERSSDGLHRHRPPAAGRSTITYSFYASNDYLIFNPDVWYKVGYPGQSAYDAVVSGTEAMIKRGFVDAERVALQGHSWGGYQIAHIVTKTDLFRCAESGAPVVNMISAYGGIRWGSGLSRMFQYEHTQSRIGATLWERPDLYIENSPIFNVDRINTPLLILHNDKDTAVPWYQGIEFFVALRRLGKPAWMLNYNGETHWPLKWQNRLDFNRRLFQFFNHYLKDAPMPRWMQRGVPATEKGILQGYELDRLH